MAYGRYVFISKPSFRVIKIAQREIVSGSLLLLCALTLILRLRGFGSRGLRLCAIREFGLRGLRLRAIREALRSEMRVRVRARVILKITNVSLETSYKTRAFGRLLPFHACYEASQLVRQYGASAPVLFD